MFDNLNSIADIDKAQERRILRYISAVGSATFLAVLFNWPLAFCAPLLTAKFIVDKPQFHILHVKQLGFALVSTAGIGFLLSTGLPEYKFAFLTLFAGLLLWGYYLFTDPKWVMFATFLIIELILLPSVTIIDQQAAVDVGMGFAFSGIVAVSLYAISHVYFPEEADDEFKGFPPSPLPKHVRWAAAVRALMISFPLVCVYFYFQLSQVLLSVAFILLLSFMTTSEKAGKTSIFYILSNLLGGAVAFVAFLVMSFSPNIYIYLLVMLLVVTLFGRVIYLNPQKAPIFATAFTGFSVLMGTSMSTGALDDKFFVRIFQLLLVTIYLVFMAYFIEGREAK
ncbi:DUF2955 domain-containing protein [Shewanella sp. Isolate13]|uniref:DUF2955 domain-containing protein n=1 Tax=Shewanella sp. Isolate13 TaxID=2908531 RepID=UPI001EFCDF3D|nr:DUF2955 domain-containing protein [Shewanella sp. Isolate13]MCG9729569.1 DUF2955 domain-containing protein [Shewanella sp. Isolate13]